MTGAILVAGVAIVAVLAATSNRLPVIARLLIAGAATVFILAFASSGAKSAENKPMQICTGECQKSAPAPKPKQKLKQVVGAAPLSW
ncbi:MAG: hypothetical protein V4474_01495 [Patescibacteria group bacterium]